MFILHTPKSEKPTSILIKKQLPDGQFKESLAVKILPGHWNKKEERAELEGLNKAVTNENKSINSLLDKIEAFIEARTRDARYTGNHLTCEELSEKLQELTGKRKYAKAATGFFTQCDAIIDDMRTGIILTPEGKIYSPATLKCYAMYLRNFKEFDPLLSWVGITLDFYRSFIKWCNDKDFSMNYIGQHINKLIVLMKEAKKRGLHNNMAYLDADFKRLREETDDISLTPAELDKIYKQNITNQTNDIARDWFIIDCYLGLRVSDIQMLDLKNFEKDRVTIANEKTDTKVVIPLRAEVREILKKWKGLPPKITDQEINRSIKEICELLASKEVPSLNDIVLYSLTKGGSRKDFYLKKWEMVSCHTARRSFITNLLNAGVPDNQVMQLAGIRKHGTLLRYKKTKPEETADILKNHEFFKDKK